MTRQSIDGGGWFNLDAAEVFDESTRWDGRNRISLATNSQFAHEELFRTAKGAWILHQWSQWQGTQPRWERVSAVTAKAWLARHRPESLLAIDPEALASFEV